MLDCTILLYIQNFSDWKLIMCMCCICKFTTLGYVVLVNQLQSSMGIYCKSISFIAMQSLQCQSLLPLDIILGQQSASFTVTSGVPQATSWHHYVLLMMGFHLISIIGITSRKHPILNQHKIQDKEIKKVGHAKYLGVTISPVMFCWQAQLLHAGILTRQNFVSSLVDYPLWWSLWNKCWWNTLSNVFEKSSKVISVCSI